jgi:hypothetical protein
MKNRTIDISQRAPLLGTLAAIAISTLMAGCTAKNGAAPGVDSTTVSSTTMSSATSTVDRGKYLVTTGGCNDCHTPWKMGQQGPEPDMTKMLSGHPAEMKIDAPASLQPPWMIAGNMTMTAWSGPWGISFTANLTPDSATGIGTWTQDQFMKALKSGKHQGSGRPILPPMPWNWLSQMTDPDLASIYMYLRTIPPISNKVPDPMPVAGMPPGAPPLPPGVMPPPMPPMPNKHHRSAN